MFINIKSWKYDNETKKLISSERIESINNFEELENDLIIYLENESNVYKMEFEEDIEVIELWIRENDKRLVEYYICLAGITEEEKIKIKKLVLDYYKEVML